MFIGIRASGIGRSNNRDLITKYQPQTASENNHLGRLHPNQESQTLNPRGATVQLLAELLITWWLPRLHRVEDSWKPLLQSQKSRDKLHYLSPEAQKPKMPRTRTNPTNKTSSLNLTGFKPQPRNTEVGLTITLVTNQ